MGVADGVYMWKTQGIDAGLFSRKLMATARREVEHGSADALAGAGCWYQRLQHFDARLWTLLQVARQQVKFWLNP